MQDIKIEVVKEVEADQVLELYRLAGWWQTDEDPRHLITVQAIIKNTWRFVVARDQGKIIGMGRAISDGVSDAYIQDVTVHHQYRGRGIGKAIIRSLVKQLKEDGLQWIGLISEPGYEAFYSSLGFAVMPGYTPFLLANDPS